MQTKPSRKLLVARVIAWTIITFVILAILYKATPVLFPGHDLLDVLNAVMLPLALLLALKLIKPKQ